MYTLAHLVKGIGPSDLYLRVKSFSFIPFVYRPEIIITQNSIHIKFPGSDRNVEYTDPSNPNLIFVAQKYRPLSLLYVLDATEGECEISDFVPQRCDDFAAYIPWFFSLLTGDLRRPPRLNPATFGVRYDGVYPYSLSPSSSDFVVDTVCYGSRSKCFTANVNDILLTEVLRELQYLWCYASLRVGSISNSFLYKAVSEFMGVAAFRCENRFPGSPPLGITQFAKSTIPIHSRKISKVVYDSSQFTCANVPAVEPLQLRTEEDCRCERIIVSPYLRARLTPIQVGPSMPPPTGLPPGYSSTRKPFLQIPTNARWGIKTVSFDGDGAGVTVSCPTEPFEQLRWPDPFSRAFASQVVPYIFGYSDIAGDCPPYRTCVVSTSNPQLNYDYGLCGTYQAITFQSLSSGGFAPSSFIYAENYYGLECGSGDRYKLPIRGGAATCVALIVFKGTGPDGKPIYETLDTFRSGIPPIVDTPSRPPDEPTNCFLTTNSITAVILNIQSGSFKFKTEVTISAPPLCESYAPKDVLGQLALLLDSYMDQLGIEYKLGPVSFRSNKGAPCQCP